MDPEEVTSSIATSRIGIGSTGIPAISDEDSDTDEEFVTDALLIFLADPEGQIYFSWPRGTYMFSWPRGTYMF